jgi:hypothetical protein
MELKFEENIEKMHEKNGDILEKKPEKSAEMAIILEILNISGFVLEDMDMLDGLSVPRDIFLDKDKYFEVAEYLETLKKLSHFSSSTLTSLHSGADVKQRWPLLNLVRQILKVKHYRMKPYRKTAGKDKDGKKKYVRYFLIEKLKKVNDVNINI